MTPAGVLAVIIAIAFVGVLWFGFSITRSISQRDKPLRRQQGDAK